ncbi:MAG: hypothetical protein E7345_04170 [Clostridiales bacterium]|nr:hypothetical protein [Clostridiales bacterium]
MRKLKNKNEVLKRAKNSLISTIVGGVVFTGAICGLVGTAINDYQISQEKEEVKGNIVQTVQFNDYLQAKYDVYHQALKDGALNKHDYIAKLQHLTSDENILSGDFEGTSETYNNIVEELNFKEDVNVVASAGSVLAGTGGLVGALIGLLSYPSQKSISEAKEQVKKEEDEMSM